MLCHLVRKEHVSGPARSVGDALSDGTVVRWRQIRPSHTCMLRALERLNQILQPMRIGPRVIIDVGNEFAGGLFEPRIAGAAKPTIFSADDPALVLGSDGTG